MLKAEVSIPVAVGVAALTYGIYQWATPNLAETRTVPPGTNGDAMLGSSERVALIASAGLATAVSLIAKDPVPFIVGAGLAVVMSWSHRYARAVDPMTNSLPRATGERYMVEAAG
jgi:type IV secretory pathway TrbD component